MYRSDERHETDFWKVSYVDEDRRMIGIYAIENPSLKEEVMLCAPEHGGNAFMELYNEDSDNIIFQWVETREVEGEDYRYYFQTDKASYERKYKEYYGDKESKYGTA